MGAWPAGPTWDGFRLGGRPEGHGGPLRLPLLVLRHHHHVVLGVPLEGAEDHVVAVAGHPDLGFPL